MNGEARVSLCGRTFESHREMLQHDEWCCDDCDPASEALVNLKKAAVEWRKSWAFHREGSGERVCYSVSYTLELQSALLDAAETYADSVAASRSGGTR